MGTESENGKEGGEQAARAAFGRLYKAPPARQVADQRGAGPCSVGRVGLFDKWSRVTLSSARTQVTYCRGCARRPLVPLFSGANTSNGVLPIPWLQNLFGRASHRLQQRRCMVCEALLVENRSGRIYCSSCPARGTKSTSNTPAHVVSTSSTWEQSKHAPPLPLSLPLPLAPASKEHAGPCARNQRRSQGARRGKGCHRAAEGCPAVLYPGRQLRSPTLRRRQPKRGELAAMRS